MLLNIEIEREEDGRWIAEVAELPGVMAYAASPGEAKAKVQALALRVVADRIENEGTGLDFSSIARHTGLPGQSHLI
jgi:predicted RNase H-like HicB family nuclease